MSEWFTPAERRPPLHQQVLVEMREGVGQVCDVAVYLGTVVSDGVTAEQWRFTDIRLNAKQIRRWAFIYPQPPVNALREAFIAGWHARDGGHLDSYSTQELSDHWAEHDWQEHNR